MPIEKYSPRMFCMSVTLSAAVTMPLMSAFTEVMRQIVHNYQLSAMPVMSLPFLCVQFSSRAGDDAGYLPSPKDVVIPFFMCQPTNERCHAGDADAYLRRSDVTRMPACHLPFICHPENLADVAETAEMADFLNVCMYIYCYINIHT